MLYASYGFWGAHTTWAWVPEMRDDNGESRRLEELENLMSRLQGSGGVTAKLMRRLGARDRRELETESITLQIKEP